MADDQVATRVPQLDPAPWLQALGGQANLVECGAASSRLWIRVRDAAQIEPSALTALGVKAIATPAENILHLIVGAQAEGLAAALYQ